MLMVTAPSSLSPKLIVNWRVQEKNRYFLSFVIRFEEGKKTTGVSYPLFHSSINEIILLPPPNPLLKPMG